MALSFRLIWALFIGLFKSRVPPHGPVTRCFTVLPFLDAETGITLNAAKYFQLAEIVQTECNLRSGFIQSGIKNGVWAIALGSQIFYKKPFKRFQKVKITSELIGWNEKFFVWQNIFRNKSDEICAVSFSKVAARSKKGFVSAEECFRMMKLDSYERPLRMDVDTAFRDLEAVAHSFFKS